MALLLLFAVSSQAQSFKEGMIVTIEGDTMVGLVAPNNETTFSFKKDRKAVQEIIPAKDVLAFSFDNEEYQKHTVEVLRGNFPEKIEDFLLVKVTGPVKLLEYKGKGIFGSEHVNYYLQNNTETPYRVNQDKNNFKKTMSWYFAENEELAAKIKQKELGYNDLMEIVNTFNGWFIQRELEEMSKHQGENQ